MSIVTAPDGVSQALSIDEWFANNVVAPAITAQPGQLGYSTDAAAMAASWTSLIAGMCQQWPWRCAGIDINSMIAAGVNAVLAGRQSGVAVNGGGTLYPNQNISCSPGYVAVNGVCVPAPCPPGMYPFNGRDSGSGCSPNPISPLVAPAPGPTIPVSGPAVGPGLIPSTVPAGSSNTPTAQPTLYSGPSLTTIGGSTVPVPNGSNLQTPLVAANLVPASTLQAAMQSMTGYNVAPPSAWCALLSQMLGGFNCPALPLSSTAPVNAVDFLAALRLVESAQTAAPAITQGGFQPLTGGFGGLFQPGSFSAGLNSPVAGIGVSPLVLGGIGLGVLVLVLILRR